MARSFKYACVLILVTLSFFGGAAWQFGDHLSQRFSPPPERHDVSRPSLLLRMQALGRLESYVMELEKIVEWGTCDGNFLQRALYEDCFILIGNGVVIAGFDLRQLSEQNKSETSSTVTLRLGRPMILIHKLDNAKTRVYRRDVGTFNSPSLHLESQARNATEEAIVKTACTGGILEKAGDAATQLLTPILEAEMRRHNDTRHVVVTYEHGTC